VVLVSAEQLETVGDSGTTSDEDQQVPTGLIALASVPTPSKFVRLCAPKTASDFAAQLYGAMRNADQQKISIIYVVAPTGTGIERAIADRLARAAAIVEG
jgi:hypothetical protein